MINELILLFVGGLAIGCFVLYKMLVNLKSENKTLKHAIEREKLIEKRKENFIANLTHDLKSPTFAQINSINMLLDGNFGYLNSEQKEILDLAKGSCKYVSDLISTILDTYKCDNGSLTISKKPFDLINLVLDLKKTFIPLAKEKNQNIFFNMTTNEMIVLADKLQIKRVMVNMINNAITYGDKNSDINIDIKKKKNLTEFLVSNKCDPIPEIETNSLFKKFQQTDKSKLNSTSTGLGLYLSKQIIEMHNGKIFAKNGKDRTCTFGFSLNTAPEKTNSEQELPVCTLQNVE